MNASLMSIELIVTGTALVLLLVDLWIAPGKRRLLGYVAAAVLACTLIGSFFIHAETARYAFSNGYVLDPLALFFKRFFLLAAIFVLVLAVDFSDRIPVGITEFYVLILFALTGMLYASSTNDFMLLFVSLELITVTFYVLTSYQRSRVRSLEAGVKYLILGALSTGFTVFGIALIFGSAESTNFREIAAKTELGGSKLFLLGGFMVLVGLGFKIAAFPFQIWAPDVYQGSPAPVTAFLAVGSKAAGFVLLLRVLFGALPAVTREWNSLLVVISIVTILYGNLCALPQRNLKRLLGYSSIGNAGYLLLGISALSASGQNAVLYYLLGYLFTVLAAFYVISIVSRSSEDEDISILAGLHQRSPLLATTLALAMISLAGIPPLAGFFGKFLLLKSVVEHGVSENLYRVLLAVALFGIVTSFYYYLAVVRAIYWSKNVSDYSTIPVTLPVRVALYACVAGMLYLGIFPNSALNSATRSVASLPALPSVAEPPRLAVH